MKKETLYEILMKKETVYEILMKKETVYEIFCHWQSRHDFLNYKAL